MSTVYRGLPCPENDIHCELPLAGVATYQTTPGRLAKSKSDMLPHRARSGCEVQDSRMRDLDRASALGAVSQARCPVPPESSDSFCRSGGIGIRTRLKIVRGNP
jgi:hypothetical protein